MRAIKKRAGLASLELVMITAVVIPLAAMLFLLAVKMAAYVFGGTSGLLSTPWL